MALWATRQGPVKGEQVPWRVTEAGKGPRCVVAVLQLWLWWERLAMEPLRPYRPCPGDRGAAVLGRRDSASYASSSRGLRGPCPVPTVGDLPGPQAAGTVRATRPCAGSVNAGAHNRSRRSRVIAKGQEGGRWFPAVNRAPVPGALAVAARGRARRDLQVLAEDGLEGLVPVHHGAEHQRLLG